MPVSRLIFLALSLALTACNLPEPKEALDGDGSTFAIASFEGKTAAVNIDSQTGFPTSNDYNFKVCLTDLKQKRPMIANHFRIEEADKKIDTDVNGCLTWTERIEYNFLAQSKYLKFTRTVSGLGPHRGSRDVNFALDPWSHGEKQPADAVDLSKGSVPEEQMDKSGNLKLALLGRSDSQKDSLGRLWLANGRLLAQEDRFTKNGYEITYEFHGSPQVNLEKINGEKVFYDLIQGRYNIEFQLINTFLLDGKVQRKVLVQKRDEAQIINKSLSIKGRYAYRTPYFGHLFIGIKLSPKDDASTIKPFEGIYYLGDYHATKATGWMVLGAVVEKHADFTLKNFIEGKYEADEITMITAPPVAAASGSAQRGYDEDLGAKNQINIQPLTFSGGRLIRDDGHHRTIGYQVIACFNYPVDGDLVKEYKMSVTNFRKDDQEPAKHPNLNPLPIQTNGCISWPEEIEINAYECQHFIKGFVDLENADLGVKRRVNYFVNPWGSTPEIALDEFHFKNVLGHECDKPQQQEQKLSYIFVSGYKYSLMGLEHELDSNLNIVVHRKLHFEIDLSVKNYSDMSQGRAATVPLRDGYFLIKTVLTTNDADADQPKGFIAASEDVVMARSGHLNIKPMKLTFLNPRDLGNRNRMLIEILPLDESKIQEHVATDGKTSTWTLRDGGTDFNSAVDKNAGLTPIIYESQVVLAGETGTANIADSAPFIISGMTSRTMSPEDLEKSRKILDDRRNLMNTLVGAGKAYQNQMRNQLAEKSTLQNYARDLSMVLFDLDKDNQDRRYLQKLVGVSRGDILDNSVTSSMDPKKRLSTALAAAKPVSPDTIVKMTSGKEIDPSLARALCFYYMSELISPALTTEASVNLNRICARVSDSAVKKFFVKEDIYHVNKAGNFRYQYGLFTSMSVATSFSVASSHSESHAQQLSANANLGLSFKYFDFLGFGVGGQAQISKTSQSASTQTNTVTVTSGLPLILTESYTRFDLLDYEVCQRIRIDGRIFSKQLDFNEKFSLGSVNYFDGLRAKLKAEQINNVLSRGVLICHRPEKMIPLSKTEKFYIIQQQPPPSEILDGMDVHNRYLFMNLRGRDDFNRFEMMTKNLAIMPTGFYLQDLKSEEANAYLRQGLMYTPSAPRFYVDTPLEN